MCTRVDCPKKESASTKECSKCGEQKPYSAYSFRIRSTENGDFHQPWCKFCDNNHHKLRPYLVKVKCKVANRTYRTITDVASAYRFVDEGGNNLWVAYCQYCTYYHTIRKERVAYDLSNYNVEGITVFGQDDPIPLLTRKGLVRKH